METNTAVAWRLHRHLRSEAQSFQAVLNATRTELSVRYLAGTDISVKEISFLLGFRDPNTFYRAFRGWTGMTPTEARAQRPQQPGRTSAYDPLRSLLAVLWRLYTPESSSSNRGSNSPWIRRPAA